MNTILIVVLLIISVTLNVMLVWYIKRLIQEFKYMSGNVDQTSESLNVFVEHLEKLYELETYYGDETLKRLIEHSKDMLEEIKGFETVISLINKEEPEGLDEEEE